MAFVAKVEYGSNNRSYMLRFANDMPDFGFTTDGTAGTWQWCPSEKAVKEKTWVHVTGTFDGRAMNIYVNGELEKENKQSAKIFEGSTPFQLAQHGNDSGYFAGVIDEVALFNRALSASEVKEAMNGLEKFIRAVTPQGKLTTTWGNIKNQ